MASCDLAASLTNTCTDTLDQAGGGDGFDLIHDSADTNDFLERERAALGVDADQFGSFAGNVPTVSVQDGDDDLIGGGGQTNGASEDVMRFESSFPSIDTHNEVRSVPVKVVLTI